MINALFMVDETFTGDFKQYKIIDGEYKLLKSKCDKKLDITRKKSNIEVIKQQIEDQEKKIDKELFKKYFEYKSPSEMLDNLFSLDNLKRNEATEKNGNNFKYLSDKVKELPSNEGVEESKILEVIGKILEFNREHQGAGIRRLTLNQMLSRLPISLA